MKTCKLVTTILLSSLILLFSSCQKDNGSEAGIPIEHFTYDGVNSEIKGAGIQFNTLYSFVEQKELINGFTFILIDGQFHPNDTELISTSTTQGIYVEVEFSNAIAENIEEVVLEETFYDSFEEGAFFNNITVWTDNETYDGNEYAFPDEFSETEIVNLDSGVSFIEFAYDANTNTAEVDCSYHFELENGKLFYGTYSGTLQVELN